MLNSTTNRLRADFDSRRRSSTGRVSSISTSNNNLRQVHRIFDDDDDSSLSNDEDKRGHNSQKLKITSGSMKNLGTHESKGNVGGKGSSERPNELSKGHSQYHRRNSVSKQKHQPSRRKSSTRYSIANRVHPSLNDTIQHQQSYKNNNGQKNSTSLRRSSTSTSTTKERRGSRLMRYSIARRIKSHDGEQNDEDTPTFDPTFDPTMITEESLIQSKRVNMSNKSDVERLERQTNQLTRPWFIILPSNKYRITWDVFIAWLLASMAFYVPFRVCMYWDDDISKSTGTFWFELFTDITFALDIMMNFVTAYQDPTSKCMVCNPKRIAVRYLKGYFFFDFVATIPFNYILSSSNGNLVANKLGKLGRLPRMVRFLKAVRLLKLLRVYKLKDFITKLETEYNIHHGITKMIKILATVLLVTHLAGCFWHLVGLTSGNDVLDGGWIFRYSFDHKSVPARYVASLYWAFSTLTTVGYGDISARAPQEQIYSMAMMLLGVSWYAYVVSTMATVMSTFDAIAAAVREKMVCVNEFIRGAKLPPHVGRQVRSYFEFKLANSQRVFLMNKHYDADEILYELSSSLRADIMLYMERELVARIPFFENKVNQFVADTVAMLQPMVSHEGEFIVKEGSQADEMFFLTRGQASVLYGNKHVFTLEEGSYFGEIGCLVGGIRRAGVKALTTCELQALSRRNLNILILEYPDVGEELKRVAKDRAKVVKQERRSSQTVKANLETKKYNRVGSNIVDSSFTIGLTDEIVDTYLKETLEKMQKDMKDHISNIKQ